MSSGRNVPGKTAPHLASSLNPLSIGQLGEEQKTKKAIRIIVFLHQFHGEMCGWGTMSFRFSHVPEEEKQEKRSRATVSIAKGKEGQMNTRPVLCVPNSLGLLPLTRKELR
jgi:hypothetical protein